jgi:F-box protein 21
MALARRLGFTARVLSFPEKIITEVRSANPEISSVYVDVYADQQHILSSWEDIPQVFVSSGEDPSSLSRFLLPSRTSRMLVVATTNVLVSHRMMNMDFEGLNQVTESDFQDSLFVAFYVHAILSRNFQPLAVHVEAGRVPPLDCAVTLSVLPPLLPELGRPRLEESCKGVLDAEEFDARIFRPRSGVQVRFFVGMVFQHTKYDYIAYIVDWQVCYFFS